MSLPKLETFITPEELENDTKIEAADLDSAMIRHTSLYVHYATQTVKAKRQYDKMVNALEILEARLYSVVKTSLTPDTEKAKPPTETAIKNGIIAHPKYLSMKKVVSDALEIYKYCQVAESAFLQRKDMLLELARDRRKEREGQLRVLEQPSQDLRTNAMGILANRS